MGQLEVPHAPGRPMEVDTCDPCRALWFDTGEHIRLTAEGALALIRHLAAPPSAPRGRFGARLACPACRQALARTYDIAGGAQYRYFRCIDGHGIFIAVFDFLRSRGLVRGLSAIELTALREQMTSVSCPGCGAPVELGSEPACAYCGSAVSIIDTEHLSDALRTLEQEAAAARAVVGPTLAPEDIVAEWRATRLSRDEDDDGMPRLFTRRRQVDLLDLGAAALSWLLRPRR
jgi:hypothetical protein